MEKIKNYNIGDQLILDLGHESLIGELTFINKDRTRLTMKNVKNLQTHEEYKSIQNFFKSEIVSIHCDNYDYTEDDDELVDNKNNTIDDFLEHNVSENSKNTSQLLNNDQNNISSTSEKLIKNQQECRIQRKNMKIFEFNKIDTCLENMKYIIQTDMTYHNALKDLNTQKLMAIYIEPCKFGRNDGPTTIITIYSPNTNYVYIIDMNFIGTIYLDLKEILMNPKIIKIIYDSRILCDHMKYNHKIELNGIFDCLVSHLTITKNNMQISLRDCLMKYINIPNSYFCDEENEIDWYARPLDDYKKIYIAKTVIFLYKLYEIHNQILHDKMLEKFAETCIKFAQTYSNNDDMVLVAAQMSINEKTSSNRVCNTNLFGHLNLENITN